MSEEGAPFQPIRDQLKGAPAFAEAYPRFDSLSAQKAVREEKRVCVFNLPRRRLGHLEIRQEVDLTERSGWLMGRFQMLGGPPLEQCAEGSFLFHLELVSVGVKELRWHVSCPVCEARKRILVYARAWACAKCHRLLSRSQVIDPRVKLFEEREALRKLVSGGRPEGMWSSTWHRKVEELAVLEERVGTLSPAYASAKQQALVSASWMGVMDDWDWLSGMSREWWDD